MALRTPLVFQNVSFAYRKNAVLHDVSVTVEAGEGVALLGHNGAGKTTLTRLAMALEHPAAGTVTTVGRTTTGHGPEDLADRTGYLFQHPEAQLVERTLAAEIALGPRLLGWQAGRVAPAVAAALAEVGLAGRDGEHPLDLPLPFRRLAALAAALVVDPVLLLLDEPTSGLDRRSRERVAEIVRRRREGGTAVVAVTHDPAFAVECLDRGVILRHGRIVADGTLREALAGGDAAVGPPPLARLDAGAALGATTWRLADVAAALAARCRGRG